MTNNRLSFTFNFAVLIFVIIPMCTSNGLYAQEKDTISLNEVVLKTHLGRTFKKEGKLTRLITRSEIESLPIQTLSETLDLLPALDLRQRGMSDLQTDISIRGGTFNQNMVLLNGINVTNPHTGHNTLSLPVSFFGVDQIEVLKGAGGKLYGYSAFSGAINFTTGLNKSPLKVELMGGDFGFKSAQAKTYFETGNQFEHHLMAGYQEGDGHQENTDFESLNLFYHGKYQQNRTQLDWMAGYANKGFGAFNFYTPRFSNQFEEVTTQFAALKWNQDLGKLQLNANIYGLRSNDRFELFRENPPTWYTQHNKHQTDVVAAQLGANYTSAIGKTSLHSEWRRELINSNVLGEPQTSVKEDENLFYTATKEAEFNHFFARNILDVTLAHQYNWKDLKLNIGLKSLHVEGVTKFYPGADLGYKINRSNYVVASVNKSMRLPTFTDLFYKGPTQISNPNLRAEEAITYDLTYAYKNKILNAQAAVFYRDAKNLIDWTLAPGEEVFRSMNISELGSFGVEVETDFNLAVMFDSEFLNNLRLGYSYLDNSDANEDFESTYAFDFLKHKLTANLVISPLENFQWSIGGFYQKRNGGYQRFVNEEAIGFVPYDDVITLNTKISYKYKKLTFLLDVFNILDQDAFDYGNILLPGRWAKFGVSFSL